MSTQHAPMLRYAPRAPCPAHEAHARAQGVHKDTRAWGPRSRPRRHAGGLAEDSANFVDKFAVLCFVAAGAHAAVAARRCWGSAWAAGAMVAPSARASDSVRYKQSRESREHFLQPGVEPHCRLVTQWHGDEQV
jgi:hypothetical protein